jgi:hypothetical protein
VCAHKSRLFGQSLFRSPSAAVATSQTAAGRDQAGQSSTGDGSGNREWVPADRLNHREFGRSGRVRLKFARAVEGVLNKLTGSGEIAERHDSSQARSPFTLVDATARDSQSTQDNEKHDRGDYRPPIIFGTPWVGPPTVVARSTSAFKVSIYHRKANVPGFAEFRCPRLGPQQRPRFRGARGQTIQESSMRTAGFITRYYSNMGSTISFPSD